MIIQKSERRFRMREAVLGLLGVFGLLAACTVGVDAQVVIKNQKDQPEAKAKPDNKGRRGILEVSGFTRPGNPDDSIDKDGSVVAPVAFQGDVQKFKVMGGTVYFAVFKNDETDAKDGDTFGTGLDNFDGRFQAGQSFRNTVSPRFDRKAKYLYLYQMINDRNLDPRITNVAGTKKPGGIGLPIFEKGKPTTKAPKTEDLSMFALKLVVDPQYITSWGHFHQSGFAANVIDTDLKGKPIRQVVDKVEVDTEIRLALSHLPAIQTKIPNPRFSRRARANSLGALEKGFGVDNVNKNLQESKAYDELKQVLGEVQKEGDVSWVNFVKNLTQGTEVGREPTYVQIQYAVPEERIPLPPGNEVDDLADDVTRIIFRADWDPKNPIKQGERSVLFGFTSDLPPIDAPIRIDTPEGAAEADKKRLTNFFADSAAVPTDGDNLNLTINTTDAGDGTTFASILNTDQGMEFVQGGTAPTAFGTAPTPAGAAPAVGGGGISGGFGSLGGATGGGAGGGGFGFPGFGQGGGLSRGGGIGSGGGLGNGGGQAAQEQRQRDAQAQQGLINFNATLTNQQQQGQQQGQFQKQNQRQNQHQSGNGGKGHVIPAPASLLLAAIGLPALWFLRRRKIAEPTATV